MARRCSQCDRFASVDQADPEVQSLEVSTDGNVSAEVRLILESTCCNDEIAEANLSVDEYPDAITEHLESINAGEEHDLNIEEDYSTSADRFQTTDRHGKTIENSRYQRHFYGFELGYAIECSCGWTYSGTLEGEEQASAFEDLN